MNNILYIANCHKNCTLASSIAYSFIQQKNYSTETQLNILIEDSIVKDIYYNYFIDHNNYIKFYNTNLIKDIIGNDLQKYNWYAILSNNCLYGNEYVQETKSIVDNHSNDNAFIVLPSNTKNLNQKTIIVNREKIIEYIRLNLKIEDIYSRYNTDNIITYTSFQSIDVSFNDNIETKNALYSDDYCIFAKFAGESDILTSMVYINKMNNRAYNIVNNIMGYVSDQSNNMITIEWQLNNNTENPIKTIKYKLDYLTKSYFCI